jgi:hypothetical protein
LRLNIRPLVLAAAALLVLPPLLPRAAGGQTDDAVALLARHRAFVGWQLGDGTFGRLRIAGTIEPGEQHAGGQKRHFVELDAGLLSRRDEDSTESGFHWSSGFTGRVFWYSDENGFTVPRVGDERKVALAESAILAEATTTLPAALERYDDLDGRKLPVLRETIPNGVTVDLWEDPATGAYRRVDIDPDGFTRTLLLDRYATLAPGKRALAAWRAGPAKDRYTAVTTPNPTFADAQLHPPPARARWNFAPPKAFAFKLAEDGFRIQAIVGGARGNFLLDTTARSISVSQDFARRAKLQPLPERPHLAAADLTFGDGSKLNDARVSTTFEAPLEGDDVVDGVFGYDFLAGAIVDIDVDRSVVTLYDPADFGANPHNVLLPLDLTGGVPQIDATLEKDRPTEALLATAGPEAIALSNAFNGVLHLKELAETGGGAGSTPCGTLDRLRIGDVSYDAQPACFSPALPPRRASLGFEFLKYINITFDYPDASLIMVPRKR